MEYLEYEKQVWDMYSEKKMYTTFLTLILYQIDTDSSHYLDKAYVHQKPYILALYENLSESPCGQYAISKVINKKKEKITDLE